MFVWDEPFVGNGADGVLAPGAVAGALARDGACPCGRNVQMSVATSTAGIPQKKIERTTDHAWCATMMPMVA